MQRIHKITLATAKKHSYRLLELYMVITDACDLVLHVAFSSDRRDR
jgi:hypothetical protein